MGSTTDQLLPEQPAQTFMRLRFESYDCCCFLSLKNFFYQCCELVDPIPNTLNLDPDPEFWPNLDPDPGPGPDPDPGYVINFEIRDRWTIK